jgi:ankyrin repeat protein
MHACDFTSTPLHITLRLLQPKNLLDECDHHDIIPLDLALETNQVPIAKTLVHHGADLDAKDSKGFSVLHKAILRGKFVECQSTDATTGPSTHTNVLRTALRFSKSTIFPILYYI